MMRNNNIPTFISIVKRGISNSHIGVFLNVFRGLYLVALLFFLIGQYSSFGKENNMKNEKKNLITYERKLDAAVNSLHWYGQDSYKINEITEKNNRVIIYIDPYNLRKREQADIILITHPHYDHFDPKSINMISDPKTTIIAPEEFSGNLKDSIKEKLEIIPVNPGSKINVNNVKIEAVPAYNIIKKDKHPKEKHWVGYIITLSSGIRVYHAGDTERIPEMKDFHADIALLPLGPTFTMSGPEEAALAAMDVGAKVAIPMHFGLAEGDENSAKEFKKILESKSDHNIRVIIKHKEE